MTKSFAIIAASLLVASAASAQVQNTAPGSGAANNAGAALSAPAPSTASTSGYVQPATPRKIDNTAQGSGAANNVSSVLNTQAQAQTPAASATANTNANARLNQGQMNQQGSMGMQAQAGAQARPFNPGIYTSASDCLTAASAAGAALSQCSSVKAK
jgi:hypothetical protein